MNIGIGILVFFVSLIALVAEFILYFILGFGASFATNSTAAVGSLAFFFVGLMVITGATGILYPICAIIAVATKNKNLGSKIFLIFLGIVTIGYFIIFANTTNKQTAGGAKSSIEEVKSNLSSSASAITTERTKSEKLKPEINSAEQEYIKNSLVLKDIKVSEGYGQFDVPGYSEAKKGAFGNIKNTGSKSIGLLEITIYFLDSNGSRIGEKSLGVINTEQIFESTPPLKPNYSKDFGYVIEKDAPSDWAGKIEVEISKIKFAE